MSTPVIAPTTSGVASLANKWVLQVDTAYDPRAASPATPVWLTVFGMSQFTPNMTYTDQDATDFDSDGWASSVQTQRGWNISGGVQRKRYSAAEDPGQAFLRTAAFNALNVHIRWFDRYHGSETGEGYASVKWEPQGGGATDLETANFTLTGQGKLGTISGGNPYNVVPTITSALPSGAGTGATVTIVGTQFWGLSGAAAVKFGATNATSYIVISETEVRAVMPAGSAGSANITVTNPVGTSTAFTYTRGA